MKSRICICCGEPMPEKEGALSRNPNVCASCSGLADEMEEADGLDAIIQAQAPPECDEIAADMREAA
jgi:hypothetical protein